MRKPDLVIMSARDRAAVQERLEFERVDQEKQRLAEDSEQYAKYCKTFESEQRGLPPALCLDPLDFQTWRAFAPQEENNPVLRGILATQRSLLKRTAETEREAVRNGKDPSVFIAPELQNARMSEEQAIKFNAEQVRRFKENTPEFYPSQSNVEKIIDYFERNGLKIINEAMFRAAFERLNSFAFLEQRPEPEPLQIPEPEAMPGKKPEKYIGIDAMTGLEREYTPREVERMSSHEFKEAFQLSKERRAASLHALFVEPRT